MNRMTLFLPTITDQAPTQVAHQLQRRFYVTVLSKIIDLFCQTILVWLYSMHLGWIYRAIISTRIIIWEAGNRDILQLSSWSI